MPAVTTTLVALGGLGLSAAQYAKGAKADKKAQQSAAQAMADLKSIKEINPYKETQVPTLGFELAQQQMIQQQTAALDYAKSMGASGAGMVGGITEAGNAQSLNLASAANQAEYNRDSDIAQAQSGINQRQASREAGIASSELAGSQAASLEARRQKQAAIQGAFSSLTTAANSIDLSAYGNKNGASGPDVNGLTTNNTPTGGDFKDNNMLDNLYGGNAELMKFSEDAANRGLKPYYEWVKDQPGGNGSDLFNMYKEYTWSGI
jgi:hypothetical protein